MVHEAPDETVKMRLAANTVDESESSEEAFAVTIAKEQIDAVDDKPLRRRTAEFVPHTRRRDTGECTVKCSKEWNSGSGLAFLRAFRSVVSSAGDRQLAAVAAAGAVVTTAAALLVWRISEPVSVYVDPSNTGETRVGTMQSSSRSGESALGQLRVESTDVSSGVGNRAEPTAVDVRGSARLRDAVDALVNGHIDRAREIYRLLASRQPQDKATVLAAEILSRTPRPEER